jgi:hypothetical protein
MTGQRTDRATPRRAGLVAGGAFVAVGAVVLLTPLGRLDSPNGVHLWAVAVTMLVIGGWFAWSAFLFPVSRVNPPLPSEDVRMPHDPAIYDPADYERRPGYVTDVTGRTNTTTVGWAAAVAAAVLSQFLFGVFVVDRWLAWPGSLVVAVIVWQLTSLPQGQGRR